MTIEMKELTPQQEEFVDNSQQAEEVEVTFHEEVEETTQEVSEEVAQEVTQEKGYKPVAAAVGAAAGAGALGFILGKLHEQRVQGKIQESFKAYINEISNAIVADGIPNKKEEVIKYLNKELGVGGIDIIEYQEVVGTLQDLSYEALETVQKLQGGGILSKANIFKRSRVEEWVGIYENIAGLTATMEYVLQQYKIQITELASSNMNNTEEY